MIFDDRPCGLGEGPLWHPARHEFFWFDIDANTLHSKAQSWTFDLTVSAAGWVGEDALLIASEVGLHRFDIAAGTLGEALVAIEAGNPVTRSNDGRADPWGGFWIGTMGRNAEKGAGAVYRYAQGELRQIAGNITVSNSICFTPDRGFAHYTDTHTKQIMRVALDPESGWPAAEAHIWSDLNTAGLNPDGAVIDAAGTLWVACWGASAVIGLDREGREIARHAVPARHCTCPAFGGEGLRDMYVTSATQGLRQPFGDNGKTFVLQDVATGLPEYQVTL